MSGGVTPGEAPSGAAFAPPAASAMIHDRLAAVVGGSGVQVGSIGGSPTDEEVAAVVAAVEHLWPKPVLVLPVETARPTPPWRFSGRWWVRNVATRRSRPYH